MVAHIANYIKKLEEGVYIKLSDEINDQTIREVIDNDLAFHLLDTRSFKFQKFYFETLCNENKLLQTGDYFVKFKKQYSLQGIDEGFLDKLEQRKLEMFQDIKEDRLTELYFGNFHKAVLKHKDATREKDLCSFFAKFVHTFKPYDYCALDNPIKIYLGLGKEGFLISFFIISNVYKNWASNNIQIVDQIKAGFRQIDNTNKIQHEKISDLKLLDLILWKKADKLKKQKKKERNTNAQYHVG